MIVEVENGVILTIHAQPAASQTQYVGVHGKALKFRVAAPPKEGRANMALCEFLAEVFSIPKRSVEICSGHGNRSKYIKLIGVSDREVRKKFRIE